MRDIETTANQKIVSKIHLFETNKKKKRKTLKKKKFVFFNRTNKKITNIYQIKTHASRVQPPQNTIFFFFEGQPKNFFSKINKISFFLNRVFYHFESNTRQRIQLQ